jgi:hypothetical protein
MASAWGLGGWEDQSSFLKRGREENRGVLYAPILAHGDLDSDLILLNKVHGGPLSGVSAAPSAPDWRKPDQGH